MAISELAALRGIDLEASYAYSDSETDVPMLEVVGNPYAVNPDRVLARIAHERGWPILDLLATPSPRSSHSRSHTPFVVSAVVVGVAAALGGLHLQRR